MYVTLHYSYSVRDNLVMDEIDKAKKELHLFKSAGGGTICEMSVVGIRRANHTHEDLVDVATETGVHIISATGFYCGRFLPEWVHSSSVRAMGDHMTSEVVRGVGDSGVRCGVMYIGCSHPLKEVERKALQAAAITHTETGWVHTYI